MSTSFAQLVSELSLGEIAPPARISGVMGPARSLMQAELAKNRDGPTLVVVPDERRLTPAVSDLEAFFGALDLARNVLPFPAFALDPYRGLSPHLDVVSARVRALVALARDENVVVVATAAALLYRTVRPELLASGVRRLSTGDSFDSGELERYLVAFGFRHEDPVTTPGDFARRGGILDIFPPGRSTPVRLEFVGDDLEELRAFDPQTQRTTETIPDVELQPANEWPAAEDDGRVASLEIIDLRGSAGIGSVLARHEDFQASLFDYLEAGLLIVDEPAEVLRAAEIEWERVLASYGDAEDDVTRYAEPSRLLMDLGSLSDVIDERAIALQEMGLLGEETRHLSTTILPSHRGRTPDFVREIERRVAKGERLRLFVASEGMADRCIEILSEAGQTAGRARRDGGPVEEGHIVLEHGHLSQSFSVPELSLTLFTASDLFAEPPRPPPRKTAKLRRFLSDFRDLKIGDYVVHTEHGIGVFAGLKQLEPGARNEFVVLEYLGRDKLYVPVDRLDYLEKYSSAESATPKLDRLGGTGWERVQKRVKKSMRDMAQQLLKLYARRRASPGHGFSPDSAWMSEFEALFEFEETPDQRQAIDDVKRDMETPSPMDRLICGDVGYGKTEVAMRAAFKAITDDKQVAVLVPTTVLAFQHQNTFRERFAPFPVRVEMLSRFKTRRAQRQIVEDLAVGKVDIVIGTHRLFSKDVQFHDLGLLVVDEEQRFGVTHKEKLKTMRHGVDSLTMTATPIPRTLHMSLSGIRDLSVIETPPKDRMAIQTHISRLDAKVLAEAIRYELGRGGQVYYVHNRVGSIYSMANYLNRLVPEARIIVGHGQMKESELESVMLRFIRHEFDVLVSTTIIENGLDIPLVNTLMVNRADRFGLSQLYQLRGRVGRSNRRAYAYLLVPEDSHLTPLARRRLAAIREFSELGAGFRIAALDLELRGAGNVLSGQQHGHIDAVGFDLYCRLLDETVRELAGEDVRTGPGRTSLNLRLELRLPEDFIPDTNQRMSIYKRASSAYDREAIEKLQEETRDRFGPLPEKVLQFFEYSCLQVLAFELGLSAIDRERGRVVFRFGKRTTIDPTSLVQVPKELPGLNATLGPAGDDPRLGVELQGSDPSEILTTIREVLLTLTRLCCD